MYVRSLVGMYLLRICICGTLLPAACGLVAIDTPAAPSLRLRVVYLAGLGLYRRILNHTLMASGIC